MLLWIRSQRPSPRFALRSCATQRAATTRRCSITRLSTFAQIDEINRARAYAEELGIEMEVTFVR